MASVAAAVALLAPALAPGVSRAAGDQLRVAGHGASAAAVMGSYCEMEQTADGGREAFCVEASYPLPYEVRLPVHGGQALAIEHDARAQSVTVTLLSAAGRTLGTLEARPVGERGRRWSVQLPAELPRATERLGIFVRYANGGDSDWQAAIGHHGHDRDARQAVALTASGRRFTASASRWCLRPPGVHGSVPCAEVAEATTARATARAPRLAGESARISLAAPAALVYASYEVGGRRRSTRARGSGRRWQLRLPRGAREVTLHVAHQRPRAVCDGGYEFAEFALGHSRAG